MKVLLDGLLGLALAGTVLGPTSLFAQSGFMPEPPRRANFAAFGALIGADDGIAVVVALTGSSEPSSHGHRPHWPSPGGMLIPDPDGGSRPQASPGVRGGHVGRPGHCWHHHESPYSCPYGGGSFSPYNPTFTTEGTAVIPFGPVTRPPWDTPSGVGSNLTSDGLSPAEPPPPGNAHIPGIGLTPSAHGPAYSPYAAPGEDGGAIAAPPPATVPSSVPIDI